MEIKTIQGLINLFDLRAGYLVDPERFSLRSERSAEVTARLFTRLSETLRSRDDWTELRAGAGGYLKTWGPRRNRGGLQEGRRRTS